MARTLWSLLKLLFLKVFDRFLMIWAMKMMVFGEVFERFWPESSRRPPDLRLSTGKQDTTWAQEARTLQKALKTSPKTRYFDEIQGSGTESQDLDLRIWISELKKRYFGRPLDQDLSEGLLAGSYCACYRGQPDQKGSELGKTMKKRWFLMIFWKVFERFWPGEPQTGGYLRGRRTPTWAIGSGPSKKGCPGASKNHQKPSKSSKYHQILEGFSWKNIVFYYFLTSSEQVLTGFVSNHGDLRYGFGR